jgi:nickel-dependent lactate racemase
MTTVVRPQFGDGALDRVITSGELTEAIATQAAEIIASGARRVLLVPPDQTRLYSGAGLITGVLYERLRAAGVEVAVLPALGTHAPMTPDDARLLFGDRVPHEALSVHRWRDGLVELGCIEADEVARISGGRLVMEIPIAVDDMLVNDSWDRVVSIGQVVPHEVIGMANFTKNLVIGLGGAPTVHRSHFLGAVCDMETIMGEAMSPVRAVVDAAFDRFIAPRVDVRWILTVMEDTASGVVQRGLYVGRGRTSESGGAAYRAAAQLAAAVNITPVLRRFNRAVCWLDPNEFRSTWLGNKAIYRTRMAMADEGHLTVLAPGVRHFGEDATIDALIRRHGYHGTAATLAAVDRDPEIAASLGTAAHLIHGSTEGRFRVTYCTNPEAGGLTQAEVEGVGYQWQHLEVAMAELGISEATARGTQPDRHGGEYEYIPNPALGLWKAT